MHFYTNRHRFHCGIDLHARSMYVCIIDQSGEVVVDRNLPTRRQQLIELIGPDREDIVVSVECIFTWYWIADVCAERPIPFVLGHALYVKANPRRQDQERQDRLAEDCRPVAWGHAVSRRLRRNGLRNRPVVGPGKAAHTRPEGSLRRDCHGIISRSFAHSHCRRHL
jgi:hypothetical protein